MKDIQRTIVYLDSDVRRALSRRASRVRQSISDVVNQVVREFLGADPGAGPSCGVPAKKAPSKADVGNQTFEADRNLVDSILWLLYISRRQDLAGGGLGVIQIEHEFGCAASHLEFHLWYLREKGWIQRLESGHFAITVAGVDKVIEGDATPRHDRTIARAIPAAHGNGYPKIKGLLQPM
jgi:hypothetical protein